MTPDLEAKVKAAVELASRATRGTWKVEMTGQYISGHVIAKSHDYAGNTEPRRDSVTCEDSMTATDAYFIASSHDHVALIKELYAALLASEEARATDAKDAGRYRWLRYGDNDELVMKAYEAGTGKARAFDPTRDGCWLLRNTELDTAIDAAIQTKEQGL